MNDDTLPAAAPVAVDATGILLVLFTILVFAVPVLVLFPPVPPSRTEALQATHQRFGLGRSRRGGGSGGGGARQRDTGTVSGGSRSPAAAELRSLWIYPVKSCAGVELARSKVLPTGLEFDRIFTFAQLQSPFPVGLDTPGEEKSRHRWEFVTQRRFPRLATIQVDLYVPDEKAKAKAAGAGAGEGERDGDSAAGEPFLVLSFPWREAGLRGVLQSAAAKLRDGWRAQPRIEVLLPVAFPSAAEVAERGYAYEEVTIWRDTVVALNMEAELPPELCLYLGVSNRLGLFRVDPERFRQVYRCAPREAEAGYQPITGFQDAYPLHLLNLNSVRDFGSKVPKDQDLPELDERRFRANMIVDGPEAYDEETWKRIRLRAAGVPKGVPPQEAEFHVSCRTVRCKMPNVNPDNGFRHPAEPDRSLRKHRDVDEGARRHGCLGMQATPLFGDNAGDVEDMQAWVEVGMSVGVLERGNHVYIAQ